jgi:hypothetical protein
MGDNKFSLFEYKLEDMVINPAIVMIAKRGSGKSVITRDIIYHNRKLPCGVVISRTDQMSEFYRFFFPDLFIHYDITSTLLGRILGRQKIMVQKMKDKQTRGHTVDPSMMLVMDDCLANAKEWAKDSQVNEIMMNGRHYFITYILTMQTPLGLKPDLRLNFDYIFLLKEDSAINIKKLYENYASMFPNKKVFEQVFKKTTTDHRAMFIDNRKPSDEINEKVFWFKAVYDRKFTFGGPEFKQYHKNYYNPDYAKTGNNHGIGALNGKGAVDIILR